MQRYEALIEAYKKAKQAQDDYTKAVLSFTQQIAQTQGGFYQAHGIDSSFINYQAIYTKFRALVGALDKDIGDGHKQGVLKNGSLGDINSWAKHFLSMSSSSLGEFLSNGNVELRKARPYCYEGNKAKKKMTDRVQNFPANGSASVEPTIA